MCSVQKRTEENLELAKTVVVEKLDEANVCSG